MKDLLILLAHRLTTVAKLLRAGGARAVVADSLPMKQQLLVNNLSQRCAPNLSVLDRIFFWSAQDLERKLGAFLQYYSHKRVHQPLDGNTPDELNGEHPSSVTNLGNYSWIRFLQLASEAFYRSGANPVQRLLEHCGCAFGDLEELVQREGVEGALVSLANSGVYFRHDEYKGTVPVRRGSLEFQCSTDDFRNPLARLQVKSSSSGSRGAGTPVLIDMTYVKACGISCAASLAARSGERWRHSVWEVISAGSRFRLLKLSSFGTGPVRWFTQLHPQDASVNAMTRFRS